MNRRAFLALLSAALAPAGAVRADEPVERILRDLRRLGYGRIKVERTLLRRTRIVAISDEAEREIIVNPSTGEILRDLWTPAARRGGSGRSGGLIDDDDDDDDDDDSSGHGGGGDDDDDDDNSGHGNGDDDGDNSGNGGGDDEG